VDLIYAVASPYPKARDCAGFQSGITAGFATGEMGFNINLRCKNPERSLSVLVLAVF
jgi:hypothetical protein